MGMVACEKCENQFEFNSVLNPIGCNVICLSCDPLQEKDPNWCDDCQEFFNCTHTRKDSVKK